MISLTLFYMKKNLLISAIALFSALSINTYSQSKAQEEFLNKIFNEKIDETILTNTFIGSRSVDNDNDGQIDFFEKTAKHYDLMGHIDLEARYVDFAPFGNWDERYVTTTNIVTGEIKSKYDRPNEQLVITTKEYQGEHNYRSGEKTIYFGRSYENGRYVYAGFEKYVDEKGTQEFELVQTKTYNTKQEFKANS